MKIRGIIKTSLLDYPGKICTILFTEGCNLRCKYCHNPDLVINPQMLQEYNKEDILQLLKVRRHIIEGVTITGGEPTLHSGLLPFLEKIRKLSLSPKIDTNGLKPEVIQEILKEKLVDYISIDMKTSPLKYQSLTTKEVSFAMIMETINLIKNSSIDYEIRTTCIPEYVTIDDFKEIHEQIGYVKRYYLQQFVNSVPLLDNALQDAKPYNKEMILQYRDYVKSFAEVCEIRWL